MPTEGAEAIVRNRPGTTFKELKGIRKLHCVKKTAEQGKVFVRNRTCYCIDCINGEEGKCTNKEWVDEWREVQLERESSDATARQTVETTQAGLLDTVMWIADLATKGRVVAIAAADDPDYECYLLKVTIDGVIELESAVTDDYGCSFERGSVVLKGNFFVRDNLTDMTYKLDKSKSAFVLVGTVCHVCGELKHKHIGIFQVPLEVNE